MQQADQAEPAEEAQLDRVRLRLVDAAGDLRPLGDGLVHRIERVQAELRSVQRELTIMGHVAALEEAGLVDDVHAFEARLDGGWVPDARPVEDVLKEWRSEFA